MDTMNNQTKQARSIFQTIVKLLEQGAPVAMILDENSPTLDAIRDWLAADEEAPTQQAASALTDERIEMFWRGAIIRNVTPQAQVLDFARSIEAAIPTTAWIEAGKPHEPVTFQRGYQAALAKAAPSASLPEQGASIATIAQWQADAERYRQVLRTGIPYSKDVTYTDAQIDAMVDAQRLGREKDQ